MNYKKKYLKYKLKYLTIKNKFFGGSSGVQSDYSKLFETFPKLDDEKQSESIEKVMKEYEKEEKIEISVEKFLNNIIFPTLESMKYNKQHEDYMKELLNNAGIKLQQKISQTAEAKAKVKEKARKELEEEEEEEDKLLSAMKHKQLRELRNNSRKLDADEWSDGDEDNVSDVD